jgi:serine/threonine protein kinase
MAGILGKFEDTRASAGIDIEGESFSDGKVRKRFRIYSSQEKSLENNVAKVAVRVLDGSFSKVFHYLREKIYPLDVKIQVFDEKLGTKEVFVPIRSLSKRLLIPEDEIREHKISDDVSSWLSGIIQDQRHLEIISPLYQEEVPGENKLRFRKIKVLEGVESSKDTKNSSYLVGMYKSTLHPIFQGIYNIPKREVRALKTSSGNGECCRIAHLIDLIKSSKEPIIGIPSNLEVVDFSTLEEDKIGIALNLYEGDGAQICKRGLTLKDQRKAMIQVAKGIMWLHKNDIIHGDIKPPNFLIKNIGGEVEAIVNDFEGIQCREDIEDIVKRWEESTDAGEKDSLFLKFYGIFTQEYFPFIDQDSIRSTLRDSATTQERQCGIWNLLKARDKYSFGESFIQMNLVSLPQESRKFFRLWVDCLISNGVPDGLVNLVTNCVLLLHQGFSFEEALKIVELKDYDFSKRSSLEEIVDVLEVSLEKPARRSFPLNQDLPSCLILFKRRWKSPLNKTLTADYDKITEEMFYEIMRFSVNINNRSWF